MRVLFRVFSALAMSFLLVPTILADGPTKAADKSNKSEAGSTDASPSGTPPAANSAGEARLKSAAAKSTVKKSPPAAKKSPGPGRSSEAPRMTPMPATTGGLGLFTVEIGETLPARGFSFSAYANKFSRMPGSVTVLNLGWNIGVGLADWFTFYAGWEPYRHTHIGHPGLPVAVTPCPNGPPPQLSLNSCLDNPAFPNAAHPTIYRSLSRIPGSRPGYVEDFPFAAHNGGGVGDFTVGFKLGILSEKRGNPVSLGLRNDFFIPTRRNLLDLLQNGTQTGQFGYGFMLSLSKTWGNAATLTFNGGYRFTRDPRSNGVIALNQADQARVGAGLLLFPQSRFQPMVETTGLIFVGTATPNRTFGARDPVDVVGGFRLYPWRGVALDLGYRYMANLSNAEDRHGFVFKLGAVHWPEKIVAPDVVTLSCSADKSTSIAESGEVVTVTAQGSDTYGHSLNYNWTASGGKIDGTGPSIRWNPAGLAPGSYTITARADDSQGNSANCAVDVRVEPRPNRPPVMTCSADRTSVLIGERVNITAVASDPDGDPLTYSWRTNGGQIVGSGASVVLDTSGLAAGRYTVTGRVDDGRGGAADCSASVDVQAPPAPPQASKINECLFNRPGSARVDNVCKRILDDVALRLKNDPKATVVIVGYADPKEPKADKLAGQRAENAAKYLADNGVDRSRANTRAASGQKGADKQNRRIDIVWVPEGATY